MNPRLRFHYAVKNTVRLVDDDKSVRDFLSRALRLENYSVVVAPTVRRRSRKSMTGLKTAHEPDATSILHDMSPSEPPEKLSCVLLRLAERFANHPLRLGEVLEATQGRGFNLLLIILVLPFLTPISLPFLSTPFGLAAALIGLRLALGQKPVLSQKLRMKPLPPKVFPKLLRAGSRVLKFLEYFLKPRLAFVHKPVFFQRVTGALIAISGVLLLLPLPIPFTNFFPALTILLLAAATLERDGVCFIAGWLIFAASGLYFVLLGFGGRQIADQLRQMFTGG